jgi:hypothetical protein
VLTHPTMGKGSICSLMRSTVSGRRVMARRPRFRHQAGDLVTQYVRS